MMNNFGLVSGTSLIILLGLTNFIIAQPNSLFNAETLRAIDDDNDMVFTGLRPAEVGDTCVLKTVTKKRSKASPEKYYMKTGGGNFVAYICPSGQVFSVRRCGCKVASKSRTSSDSDQKQIQRERGSRVDSQNGTGWSLLHIAAWKGAYKVARALIEQNANIYIENRAKEQPMHIAALRNHVSIMELLFQAAGDEASQHKLIYAKQNMGQTPMFYAIKGQALLAASKLLDFGANVDTMDSDRMEPIHYAVQLGQKDAVYFLIRHGASLTTKCCFSTHMTAFHIAAEFNSVDMFSSGRLKERLVEYIRNEREAGRELICSTAEKGSVEFAKLLCSIDSSLIAEAKCPFGSKKMHMVRVGTALHTAVYHNHQIFADFLLKRQEVGVNVEDSKGSTALLDAMNFGNSGIIQMLLEYGAKVDTTDANGRTPFSLAALTNSVPIAKLLVDKGANPFDADGKGETVFHYVSDVNFLEYLLSISTARGQAINAKTKKEAGGFTPLHVALIERKSEKFITLLLDNGADPNLADEFNRYTAFHYAIEIGSISLLKLMLEKAGQAYIPSIRDRFGRTAFHLAVAKNNLEVAKLLKARGVDVNDVIEGPTGETALHVAVRAGHYDIVVWLLANEAKTDIVSELDKRNPLLEAFYWRQLAIARVLLDVDDMGASLTLADNQGRTVLHFAVMQGELGLVKLILARAKRNESSRLLLAKGDQNGDTALHHAVRLNNFDMIRYLLEHAGADCRIQNAEERNALHLAAHLAFLYQLKHFHSAGNCDLALLDGDGLTALEYPYVKCHSQFVEDLLRDYGGDCCDGTSKRLTLAIKLRLKSLISLILLSNKGECDVKELLLAEHGGASALSHALAMRNLDLIVLAFESGVIKTQRPPNSQKQQKRKPGHSGHEHRPKDREAAVANAQNMIKQLLFGPRAPDLLQLIQRIERHIGRDSDETCPDADSKKANFFHDDDDDSSSSEEDDTKKIYQGRAAPSIKKKRHLDDDDDGRLKTFAQTRKAVEMLIERMAIDVKRDFDQSGNTLLHYLAVDQAGGCKNLAATEVILTKGADPNAMNKAGLAPLHLLALSRHKCAAKFAQLLVRFDAQPDLATLTETPDGDSQLTPIHLSASRCGNVGLIDAFISMNVHRRVKRSFWDNNPETTTLADTTTMLAMEETTGSFETGFTAPMSSFTTKVDLREVAETKTTSSLIPSTITTSFQEEPKLKVMLFPNSQNNRLTSKALSGSSGELLGEKFTLAKTMELLNKKTKLGKTVTTFAIENNRFDVLERLERIAGDDFNLFTARLKAVNASPKTKSRIGRGLKKASDAFESCRYYVDQCERKISSLSECSNQLESLRHTELNSFDLLRRAVVHSSQILELNGLGIRKKFYFVVEQSMRRDDAEKVCAERGATLALLKSQPERDLLKTIVSPEKLPAELWVGLMRGHAGSDTFWWSDGTRLASNLEVVGGSSSQCVSVATSTWDQEFHLSAKSCFSQIDGALCELNFPMPEFWVVSGSSYNWSQALDACRYSSNTSKPDVGLAMPKHQVLLDKMLSLDGWPEKQSGWQGCWIGLKRANPANERRFVWNDNSSIEPVELLPWLPGQPAQIGGPEDCVQLFSRGHLEPGRAGKLNDLPCEFRLNCAICYRDL